MCGLAGGVALKPGIRPDEERVRWMTSAVAHRGPDDEGFWTSPSGAACFGHRRLSVIDLELGQQPVVDSHTCLIFNGEIYNYVELRGLLADRGCRFDTDSDTEVLREALRLFGDRAVDQLIGMFAFAFWDEREKRLLLARDRVGKKPLYHTVFEDCLYFCSTLRGLEEALPGRPKIDPTSVVNFLNLGYVPAPDTIYEGVSKLPAASLLSVSHDRRRPKLTRFWDPVDPKAASVPPDEAEDRLEELIEDAVRLRLRSDVPLGVFLSGGIDSSLVTAVACRISSNPISTFTASFDAAEFDEAPRARRVAEHLGTEHHVLRVDADVVDLLPRMVDHFGEPFADPSSLPLWLLAEAARRQITVALMGDGGDEGFAGYDWYRTATRLGRLAGFVKPIGPVAKAAAAPFGARARRLAFLLTSSAPERFANLRLMFGEHVTDPPLFTPAIQGVLDPERLAGRRLQELYRDDALRPVHAMQYVDLRTYLPGDLLPKVDVCTMAHGLEARAPLLDHRILELAYRLPRELHDVDRPKAMLRHILDRYVPPELTRGPKRGFTVPLREWFRSELRSRVSEIPNGPVVESGWTNRDVVQGLVEDHMNGRRDNSLRLFHLLVLQMWMNR